MVANTQFGLLPGKVEAGEKISDECYFTRDGFEMKCSDFSLVKSGNLSKVPDDKPQGIDVDGTEYWCAVAETEKGNICGRATKDGKCYYAIGDEVHEAKNFMYVLGEPEKKLEPKIIRDKVRPQGIQAKKGQNWCALART